MPCHPRESSAPIITLTQTQSRPLGRVCTFLRAREVVRKPRGDVGSPAKAGPPTPKPWKTLSNEREEKELAEK
jgi:hypothetical protein